MITNGETHYGWVRLSVSHAGLGNTIITGYAYETIADKPIVTGKTKGADVVENAPAATVLPSKTFEPATLGRLAQGASGLAAWRKNPEAK